MSLRLFAVILLSVFVADVGSTAAFAADPPRPKAVKAPSVASAECAWIGKRIIQLLSRDDVVAAGEFRQFYTAFGCSEPHLGAAFGCAIEGASGTETCAARTECVDLCWTSPTASTLDKADQPASKATKPAVTAPVQDKTKVQPPPPPKKPEKAKPLAVQPSGPYDTRR